MDRGKNVGCVVTALFSAYTLTHDTVNPEIRASTIHVRQPHSSRNMGTSIPSLHEKPRRQNGPTLPPRPFPSHTHLRMSQMARYRTHNPASVDRPMASSPTTRMGPDQTIYIRRQRLAQMLPIAADFYSSSRREEDAGDVLPIVLIRIVGAFFEMGDIHDRLGGTNPQSRRF